MRTVLSGDRYELRNATVVDLIRTAWAVSPEDVVGGPEWLDTDRFVNAHGSALTRYGVRYLLRRYIARAARLVPTLKDKNLHPHSIRHSTAIALLKAGVDFATISQWLGHAGLNTTMRYAKADLDLKRQAISQVFPDVLAPPRAGRLVLDGSDMVGWLRRL
jgi:integrase/recombinase XerD